MALLVCRKAVAGTRRSTPARRSRRNGGPASMCGPSPTAASARDSFTVSANEVQPLAAIDARRQLLLLREAGGDEQVEEQVAAREPLAHDEVPQQAAVAVARVRLEAEVPARLGDGQPGAVHALGRQLAVDDVDDLLPGAALVQAEHQPAVSSAPNENSILLR